MVLDAAAEERHSMSIPLTTLSCPFVYTEITVYLYLIQITFFLLTGQVFHSGTALPYGKAYNKSKITYSYVEVSGQACNPGNAKTEDLSGDQGRALFP